MHAREAMGHCRRVNITMDEEFLARIDAVAGKGHRSDFIEYACARHSSHGPTRAGATRR
jgi:metal-responsive CopG/Arc/MetJ family transcriptional regulator